MSTATGPVMKQLFPVVVVPGFMVVFEMPKNHNLAGSSRRVALRARSPYDAETVTYAVDKRGAVLRVKLTLDDPSGMTTDAGAVAVAPEVVTRMLAPPAGAGFASDAVTVVDFPATIDVAATPSERDCGGMKKTFVD